MGFEQVGRSLQQTLTLRREKRDLERPQRLRKASVRMVGLFTPNSQRNLCRKKRIRFMSTIGGSTIAAVTLSRLLGGKVAQGLALEGKKTSIRRVPFSPHTLLPCLKHLKYNRIVVFSALRCDRNTLNTPCASQKQARLSVARVAVPNEKQVGGILSRCCLLKALFFQALSIKALAL